MRRERRGSCCRDERRSSCCRRRGSCCRDERRNSVHSVMSDGDGAMARARRRASRQTRRAPPAALESFLRIIEQLWQIDQLMGNRPHDGRATAPPHDRQGELLRIGSLVRTMLPDWRVDMGFGLHVGWAVEGAIGSEHKVDASYLSPHVNMASRLEAAKQYGVKLLLSGEVHARLEVALPAARPRHRQGLEPAGAAVHNDCEFATPPELDYASYRRDSIWRSSSEELGGRATRCRRAIAGPTTPCQVIHVPPARVQRAG